MPYGTLLPRLTGRASEARLLNPSDAHFAVVSLSARWVLAALPSQKTIQLFTPSITREL